MQPDQFPTTVDELRAFINAVLTSGIEPPETIGPGQLPLLNGEVQALTDLIMIIRDRQLSATQVQNLPFGSGTGGGSGSGGNVRGELLATSSALTAKNAVANKLANLDLTITASDHATSNDIDVVAINPTTALAASSGLTAADFENEDYNALLLPTKRTAVNQIGVLLSIENNDGDIIAEKPVIVFDPAYKLAVRQAPAAGDVLLDSEMIQITTGGEYKSAGEPRARNVFLFSSVKGQAFAPEAGLVLKVYELVATGAAATDNTPTPSGSLDYHTVGRFNVAQRTNEITLKDTPDDNFYVQGATYPNGASASGLVYLIAAGNQAAPKIQLRTMQGTGENAVLSSAARLLDMPAGFAPGRNNDWGLSIHDNLVVVGYALNTSQSRLWFGVLNDARNSITWGMPQTIATGRFTATTATTFALGLNTDTLAIYRTEAGVNRIFFAAYAENAENTTIGAISAGAALDLTIKDIDLFGNRFFVALDNGAERQVGFYNLVGSANTASVQVITAHLQNIGDRNLSFEVGRNTVNYVVERISGIAFANDTLLVNIAYDNDPDVAGADANRKYTWPGDIAGAESIDFELSDITIAQTYNRISIDGDTAVIARDGFVYLADVVRNAEGQITAITPNDRALTGNRVFAITGLSIRGNIIVIGLSSGRQGSSSWWRITAGSGRTATTERIANVDSQLNIRGNSMFSLALSDNYLGGAFSTGAFSLLGYRYDAAADRIVYVADSEQRSVTPSNGVSGAEFINDLLFVCNSIGQVLIYDVSREGVVFIRTASTGLSIGNTIGATGNNLIIGNRVLAIGHNIFTPALRDDAPDGYALEGRVFKAPDDVNGQAIRGYRIRAYREMRGGADVFISQEYIWHDIFGNSSRQIGLHNFFVDNYLIPIDSSHIATINYGLRFDGAYKVVFMGSQRGRIDSNIYFTLDVMTGDGVFPNVDRLLLTDLGELPLTTSLENNDRIPLHRADGVDYSIAAQVLIDRLTSLAGGITQAAAEALIDTEIPAQVVAWALIGNSDLLPASKLTNAPGIKHSTVADFLSTISKSINFIYGEGSTENRRLAYLRKGVNNIANMRADNIDDWIGFSDGGAGIAEGGNFLPQIPAGLKVFAGKTDELIIRIANNDAANTLKVAPANYTIRWRVIGANAWSSQLLDQKTTASNYTEFAAPSTYSGSAFVAGKRYEIQLQAAGGGYIVLHAGNYMSNIKDDDTLDDALGRMKAQLVQRMGSQHGGSGLPTPATQDEQFLKARGGNTFWGDPPREVPFVGREDEVLTKTGDDDDDYHFRPVPHRVLIDVPASDDTVDKIIESRSQLYTTRDRVVHEATPAQVDFENVRFDLGYFSDESALDATFYAVGRFYYNFAKYTPRVVAYVSGNAGPKHWVDARAQDLVANITGDVGHYSDDSEAEPHIEAVGNVYYSERLRRYRRATSITPGQGRVVVKERLRLANEDDIADLQTKIGADPLDFVVVPSPSIIDINDFPKAIQVNIRIAGGKYPGTKMRLSVLGSQVEIAPGNDPNDYAPERKIYRINVPITAAMQASAKAATVGNNPPHYYDLTAIVIGGNTGNTELASTRFRMQIKAGKVGNLEQLTGDMRQVNPPDWQTTEVAGAGIAISTSIVSDLSTLVFSPTADIPSDATPGDEIYYYVSIPTGNNLADWQLDFGGLFSKPGSTFGDPAGVVGDKTIYAIAFPVGDGSGGIESGTAPNATITLQHHDTFSTAFSGQLEGKALQQVEAAVGPNSGVSQASLDAEITKRQKGDRLTATTISTPAALTNALNSQANSDEALRIHFTAEVTLDGTTYAQDQVSYVPPRSRAIENEFILPSGGLSAAYLARLLPALPARGSRNNKIAKFIGDDLRWQEADGLTQAQQLGLIRFAATPGAFQFLNAENLRGYAFNITVDAPQLLTGDIWFLPKIAGIAVRNSRTKWTNRTTAISLPVPDSNATRNNIIAASGTTNGIILSLEFYDAANGGNLIAIVRIPVAAVHTLIPVPLVNEAAYMGIAAKHPDRLYYWPTLTAADDNGPSHGGIAIGNHIIGRDQRFTGAEVTRLKRRTPTGVYNIPDDGRFAVVSWDTDSGLIAKLTLAGDRRQITNPVNVTTGDELFLEIVQDAVGGRVVIWGNAFVWAGGFTPSLNDGANASTFFKFTALSPTRLIGERIS